MEHAVQLPQYMFFDLDGEDLRCYSPAPAMEHSGIPCDTLQVIGLEALHRTRLSRAGIAATRPADEVVKATVLCDRAQMGGGGDDDDDDPDTMSDAGMSGVGVAEETAGSDEVASLDELFFDEGFVRKIDALAELVGMEGGYRPAAVLGEVVRVIQDMERKMGRSVCATRAVRS
ncbi:hypothetical protein ABZP36_015657 [Zizania latifolia]